MAPLGNSKAESVSRKSKQREDQISL